MDLKWGGMADAQLISVETQMESPEVKLAKSLPNNNWVTKICDHFSL